MVSRIYGSDFDKRRQQITTLRVFNDKVDEVVENQEYQVKFVAGNSEFTLLVYLDNDFPQSKPILKVYPPLSHYWVAHDGTITNAPGLVNFTVHSDLGRVVQAIIREFVKNPPPLLYSADINQSSCTTTKSPTQPAFTSLCATSASSLCNELCKLTVEDLQVLNSNVELQDRFIANLPSFEAPSLAIDELIQKVEDLAVANLSFESILNDKKTELTTMFNEMTDLLRAVEEKFVQYESLAERYSPDSIRKILGEAAVEKENEGEQLVEKFLSGDMSVDEFVVTYTGVKSLCQRRKAKEEKLAEQLANLKKAGF